MAFERSTDECTGEDLSRARNFLCELDQARHTIRAGEEKFREPGDGSPLLFDIE